MQCPNCLATKHFPWKRNMGHWGHIAPQARQWPCFWIIKTPVMVLEMCSIISLYPARSVKSYLLEINYLSLHHDYHYCFYNYFIVLNDFHKIKIFERCFYILGSLFNGSYNTECPQCMATNGNFLLELNLRKKKVFPSKIAVHYLFMYQKDIDWLLWGPESVLDAKYLAVLLESSLSRQFERLMLGMNIRALRPTLWEISEEAFIGKGDIWHGAQ